MAIRRRYPFNMLWNELDEMFAEWEERVHSTMTTGTSLPAVVGPALRGECRVDVWEQEDEVLVAADLPGIEKQEVSIRLIEPQILEIAIEKKVDYEETEEPSYYVRERIIGNMKRRVYLPSEVVDEGSVATFTNGVLEVRLKKHERETGTTIPIE